MQQQLQLLLPREIEKFPVLFEIDVLLKLRWRKRFVERVFAMKIQIFLTTKNSG